MAEKTTQSIFGTSLNVVNVGLRSFAESLQVQDVSVAQWLSSSKGSQDV